MDPVTAIADMVKAFLDYSTEIFKATSPEKQTAIADAHAQILINMLEFGNGVQQRFERLGDGLDKAFRRKGHTEPDPKGNV